MLFGSRIASFSTCRAACGEGPIGADLEPRPGRPHFIVMTHWWKLGPPIIALIVTAAIVLMSRPNLSFI